MSVVKEKPVAPGALEDDNVTSRRSMLDGEFVF